MQNNSPIPESASGRIYAAPPYAPLANEPPNPTASRACPTWRGQGSTPSKVAPLAASRDVFPGVRRAGPSSRQSAPVSAPLASGQRQGSAFFQLQAGHGVSQSPRTGLLALGSPLTPGAYWLPSFLGASGPGETRVEGLIPHKASSA